MAEKKTPNTAKTEVMNPDRMLDFKFKGNDYSIRADCMTNMDVLEHLEDGKYILAVRAILGPIQWAQFKDAHREHGRVDVAVLDDMMVAISGAADPTSASVD